MKKFINQVELVEDQMIQGMVKAYPQYVRKLDCGNVVVRTEKKEGKVALISGFGSESAAPVVKKMMDAYFHIGDYSPAKLKAADEAKAGGKKNG